VWQKPCIVNGERNTVYCLSCLIYYLHTIPQFG
jgi:hypothetical protein